MKVVYQGLGKSKGGNGSNYKYTMPRTTAWDCWLKENNDIEGAHGVLAKVHKNKECHP